MRGSDEITHPRTAELAGHSSTRTFATIVGRFFCASCAATVDACPAHRATPRSETLRNRRHRNEHQQTIAEIESLEGIFAAPDARPLGPSDLAAANRRHDEMTRIAIGEIGIDVGYRKFLFILGVRDGSEMRDPVGTLKTRL